MRPILRELVDRLTVQPVDVDRFVGQSKDLGWGSVFGGQVLAQALSAAAQTVATDRLVHSLHAYFLRQGDPKLPIEYEVARHRDGKSFSARGVVATQRGEPIFSLATSFHVDEPGFDHQSTAPQTPSADSLPAQTGLGGPDGPLEFRVAEAIDPTHPSPRPAYRRVWYRATDRLPDDPTLHRMLLAYASDFYFLTTALDPHGVSWVTQGMHTASVDHAMWFFRPFRFDDWVLHVIESPSASGARGFVRGQAFDTAGRLVASTAQEGLIRLRQ